MKVLNKSLAFLCGIVAIASLGYAIFTSEIVSVKDISIDSTSEANLSGYQGLNRNVASVLDAIKGKNLLTLDIGKVAGELESYKRIKEARVFRRFPNKLQVEVFLHQPTAVLMKRNGQLYPVAFDGELLNPIKLSQFPDLPLLRGKKLEVSKKTRLKAINFIESLPNKGRFSETNISEIYFSNKNGYVAILKSTGTEVLLGDNNLDKKPGAISKVLKYMDDERLKGRVIDARYLKKVVVKLY